MRSDEEVMARIRKIQASPDKDPFGFEKSDLVATLPFSMAKRYLKDEVTEGQWSDAMEIRDPDHVRKGIYDYMSFAWEKANNERGISASRTISHMCAWLWLLGEDELCEEIRDYHLYGKPQLVIICEHFGWRWRKWDDGNWTGSVE